MKVSIITASYNGGKTIRRTIKSVLDQTYKNVEYIIVDGVSTDDTVEIIKNMEPAFNGRMNYISEPDSGIYDAMNKGIRMATGEVIGILNSDDYFTSHTVIEQMVHAFSSDIDAIYGDVHFIQSTNKEKITRYYSGRIFRPWLVRFGFIPPHPSIYIRKKIFDQYGVYDPTYKISADFELIARFFYIHKISAKYLHLDFVTMLIGGASTKSVNARILGTKEDLIACKKLGIRTNITMIYSKYLIKIVTSLLHRK